MRGFHASERGQAPAGSNAQTRMMALPLAFAMQATAVALVMFLRHVRAPRDAKMRTA